MRNELLSLVNISVGYPKQKMSLHSGIHAHVNAGEFVCLLGPNGAGKSTLIKTISGFLPALSGEVYYQNRLLSKLSDQQRSQMVSVVLTEKVAVPNLNVFELVALGRAPYTGFFGRLTDDDVQKVYEAIEIVGLQDYTYKNIEQMSDGERQKIMIAKALVQDTPLIILDEPTAFLDFPAKIEVMQLLLRLARENNKGILLSTHDLEMALQIADKIWLIAQKKEMAKGIPEDLVLSGAFNSFFQRGDIHFDMHTGVFKFFKAQGKYIKVTGEGITRCWLEKALLRMGFVPSDEDGDVTIQVSDAVEMKYQLFDKNNALVMASNQIEELLQKLQTILKD